MLKKVRKTSRILIAIVVFSGIAAVVIGFFCIRNRSQSGNSMTKNHNTIDTSQPLVHASTGRDCYYVSANRSGLFYIQDQFMHYVDYDSKRDYFLCNKSNCNHNDATCNAYIKNGTQMGASNGKIYVFCKNEDTNSFDFFSMTLTGEKRKRHCSIQIGQRKAGNYVLDDIDTSDVFYGYGWAYLTLNYEQVQDAGVEDQNGVSVRKLMVIDLKTGKKTVIAEDRGMDFYHQLYFRAIDDNHIIYSLEKAPDALIGEELENAIRSGKIKGLTELRNHLPASVMKKAWKNDLYSFYSEYAIYSLCKDTYQIFDYNRNTGKIKILYKNQNCDLWYEKGEKIPSGWLSPVEILGWEGGKLILSKESQDKNKSDIHDIYRVNMDNEKWVHVKKLSNAGIIMTSFGNCGNDVRENGYFYYIQYSKNTESENGNIYGLDTENAKSIFLYKDSRYVTFRFLGETKEYFVGDMVKKSKHGVYLIEKDEYRRGNLGKAQLLYNEDS